MMECALIFDAVYQGDSKFVRETSKTQTALIAQSSLTSETRHFEYIKLIYVFCSAHVKIGF